MSDSFDDDEVVDIGNEVVELINVEVSIEDSVVEVVVGETVFGFSVSKD